jgi:hypothetical protein
MLQIKQRKLPNSFQKLYETYFSPTGRPTRQINVAKQTRARTRFSSLLPYHAFPKIWNELTPSYREIESIHKFKGVFRAYLLSRYMTNVKCNNRRCRQCFPIILQWAQLCDYCDMYCICGTYLCPILMRSPREGAVLIYLYFICVWKVLVWLRLLWKCVLIWFPLAALILWGAVCVHWSRLIVPRSPRHYPTTF